MTDRLSSLRFNRAPILTNLTQEYVVPEFISVELFPVVPVPTEEVEIPYFGTEHLVPENTKRPIRGRSNRIQPGKKELKPFKIEERDLEMPVDYREEAESDFDEQRDAAYMVKEKIDLGLEKDCADLAIDSSKYPASHVLTLSGTSQFSDHANSDPIGVADDGRSQVRSTTGREPNTIVLGYATYLTLRYHPQLTDKVKFVQKARANAELMAEFFDVDKVVVGKGVYQDPITKTMVDLYPDVFIMAYVDRMPVGQKSKHRASFGYQFRKKGTQVVDTYTESGGKLTIVRYTDICDPHFVGNTYGYLVLDCVA